MQKKIPQKTEKSYIFVFDAGKDLFQKAMETKKPHEIIYVGHASVEIVLNDDRFAIIRFYSQ